AAAEVHAELRVAPEVGRRPCDIQAGQRERKHRGVLDREVESQVTVELPEVDPVDLRKKEHEVPEEPEVLVESLYREPERDADAEVDVVMIGDRRAERGLGFHGCRGGDERGGDERAAKQSIHGTFLSGRTEKTLFE